MAPLELESQWYEALFEEDCVRVMQLLKDHPQLLKQGWESEPSRMVEGSPLNFWMPRTRSPWKGRTALHVGARRGCAELVRRVLKHCCVGALSGCEGGEPRPDVSEGEGGGKRGGQHSACSSLYETLLASEPSRQKVRKARQAVRKRGGSALVDIVGAPEGALLAYQNGDEDLLQLSLPCWKRQEDGGAANRTEYLMNVVDSLEERAQVCVSLEDFLYLKDGEYQLDAIAMAALHANLDILSLLVDPKHRSGIGDPIPRDLDLRARMRKITEGVTANLTRDPDLSATCRTILEAYSKHRDFNFLPQELYLFHFLFAKGVRNDNYSLEEKLKLIRVYMWEEVKHSTGSLWRFLLQLQDGQGRTPGHVAVDEGTVQGLGELMESYVEEDAFMDAMTAPDATGRSALHRAVALGRMDAIKSMRSMLSENQQFDLMLRTPWQHALGDICLAKRDAISGLDIESLSLRNGFGGRRCSFRNHQEGRPKNIWSPCTPLHSAIIHRRTEVLRGEFVKFSHKDPTFPWITDVGLSDGQSTSRWDNEYIEELGIMELASLVGEVTTVTRLLEEGFQQQPWSLEEECYAHLKIFWPKGKFRWPALLLAANSGNYQLLKYFVESPRCDTYIVDSKGDTALHHALTSTEIKFKTHLLDYINCEHIGLTDPRMTEEETKESERHSGKERMC